MLEFRIRVTILLVPLIFFLKDLLPANATTYSRCLHSGWIPYRNQKCLKILNIYETHSSAIEACQKQVLYDDLIDVNLHATLLQINSKDEEEFVDRLLFNVSRYADNVWLGAVRDGPRAQFRWLDGTSLNNFSVYQRWAFGNPTGDFLKNCVELRAKDNHNVNLGQGQNQNSSGGGTSDPPNPNPNSWWSTGGGGGGSSGGTPSIPSSPGGLLGGLEPPNPNAFFSSRDSGNWYNVACTKHNLVVCQISQLVPEQVVTLQVIKTKKEISRLQTEVSELKRLVLELAASVVTDIKLAGKETTDLWTGPGFPDGSSYVITGVMNWDENTCADTVSRRKFQKLVNGKWYDVY